MKIHAGVAVCADCGKRREVEYDLDTEETTCKHCGETIVPRSAHLSSAERGRLAFWRQQHPDATLHR